MGEDLSMITIRPATVADTATIVHLEMTIIDQMEIPMVAKLGRDNIEQLLHDSALADDTARYSHTHATVAELGGAIVGVAFGYPSASEPHLDLTMQRLLAERFGELAELFPDVETLPDEWYLDSISVAESARGKGVGTQLLAALPEVVAAQGETVIGLNVDDGNPKARALYEREGFVAVGELMIGAHHYTHMQRDLS
jgi:ribosomal protein S18 acetylase RimI-like enzyme